MISLTTMALISVTVCTTSLTPLPTQFYQIHIAKSSIIRYSGGTIEFVITAHTNFIFVESGFMAKTEILYRSVSF